MKNKIKKVRIIIPILMLIVLVIISGMTMFSQAELISEGLYESSYRNLGTTQNDANKRTVTLGETEDKWVEYLAGYEMTLKSNQIVYEARDMSTYKNMYCVQHEKGLDETARSRPFLILRAKAMADINGNKATFYGIDANGSLTETGTVTSTTNNIIAGILTETNITTIETTRGDRNVYKGYGGMQVTNSSASISERRYRQL